MKVLHVGHSKRWRGGENQVFLLIKGLSESSDEFQHYLAFPKDAEIFQRVTDQVKGVLAFPSEKIMGVVSLLSLVRFCRKHRIDVLHAHSARAHSLCHIARKCLPQVKVVVHRRVDMPIKQAYFTRRKYLSELIDTFVAISDKTQQALLDYGVKPDRVIVVKDGVDPPEYTYPDKSAAKAALITRFGWDQSRPLLGFVSAFDRKKNPLLFVRLLAELKKQGVHCNAVMAGSGELEQTVQAEIDRLGLAENVRLLGFVKTVQDVFQALDIFILSSKSEGLGTVLLEAAFAECVIVASDVGGVSEVVRDGHTGLLVDPNSVESFVQKVLGIYSNPEAVAEMTMMAKTFVEKEFSLARVVTETGNVYRSLYE